MGTLSDLNCKCFYMHQFRNAMVITNSFLPKSPSRIPPPSNQLLPYHQTTYGTFKNYQTVLDLTLWSSCLSWNVSIKKFLTVDRMYLSMWMWILKTNTVATSCLCLPHTMYFLLSLRHTLWPNYVGILIIALNGDFYQLSCPPNVLDP